jgi:hypothetical protein
VRQLHVALPRLRRSRQGGEAGDAVSDLEARIAKALEEDALPDIARGEHRPQENAVMADAARTLLPEAAKELAQLRRRLTQKQDAHDVDGKALIRARAELKMAVEALEFYVRADGEYSIAGKALAAITSREKETKT